MEKEELIKFLKNNLNIYIYDEDKSASYYDDSTYKEYTVEVYLGKDLISSTKT